MQNPKLQKYIDEWESPGELNKHVPKSKANKEEWAFLKCFLPHLPPPPPLHEPTITESLTHSAQSAALKELWHEQRNGNFLHRGRR